MRIFFLLGLLFGLSLAEPIAVAAREFRVAPGTASYRQQIAEITAGNEPVILRGCGRALVESVAKEFFAETNEKIKAAMSGEVDDFDVAIDGGGAAADDDGDGESLLPCHHVMTRGDSFVLGPRADANRPIGREMVRVSS
jgi:hypothetical protein